MSRRDEIQATHWEDCWRDHRDCAIARAEKAERERDRIRARVAELERAGEVLAEALHRIPAGWIMFADADEQVERKRAALARWEEAKRGG